MKANEEIFRKIRNHLHDHGEGLKKKNSQTRCNRNKAKLNSPVQNSVDSVVVAGVLLLKRSHRNIQAQRLKPALTI